MADTVVVVVVVVVAEVSALAAAEEASEAVEAPLVGGGGLAVPSARPGVGGASPVMPRGVNMVGVGRPQLGNRVLPPGNRLLTPGNRIPPGTRTTQVWTDKHGHKHFRRRFVAVGVGFPYWDDGYDTCWRWEFTRYGWQWVNVCYPYSPYYY